MNIPKGFIKCSDGNYRRGDFIFKDGQIIREAQLLPNEESKEVVSEQKFDTLDNCIRAVLSYSSDIGQELRLNNIYIKQSGDKYTFSDKESKDDVAIVTPDNNVYILKYTSITASDDMTDLALPNNAEPPKEVKDLNTKPKELTESSKEIKVKEVRTKDGKESLLIPTDVPDKEAIATFIKNYARGYKKDDVEVIYSDKVIYSPSNVKEDEETEDVPEENTTSNNLKPLSTAYFIRRPNNIEELQDKIDKHLVTPATYSIVDEVELTQEEFDNYSNNLRQDADFLKNFRPTPTDADFTVIAVKAPDGTTLLIDNSGYNSAQYVSLLNNSNTNTSLTESSTAEAYVDAIPDSKERFQKLVVTDDYVLAAVKGDDGEIWLRVLNSPQNDVSVYIQQGKKVNVTYAQVNWKAIGSVSPEEAKEYAQQINNAADFASQITGKDFTSQVNFTTDTKESEDMFGVESKLLNLLSSTKDITDLSKVKLKITDKGNVYVTHDNKDLVTLNKDNFSEEDLTELKDLGYFVLEEDERPVLLPDKFELFLKLAREDGNDKGFDPSNRERFINKAKDTYSLTDEQVSRLLAAWDEGKNDGDMEDLPDEAIYDESVKENK